MICSCHPGPVLREADDALNVFAACVGWRQAFKRILQVVDFRRREFALVGRWNRAVAIPYVGGLEDAALRLDNHHEGTLSRNVAKGLAKSQKEAFMVPVALSL